MMRLDGDPPAFGFDVLAVLLAGGLARRMGGGDKALMRLGSRTILERTIERVRPQVAALMLNANGDPARFARFGLPVEADVMDGFAGPLAGILTGLEWMRRTAPEARWLLSVPTDSPFLPLDLAARLKAHAVTVEAPLAVAASAGRTHPVIGLWSVEIAHDLRRALVEEGVRKIDAFTGRYKVAQVTWPVRPVDPFFNANRPEDLTEAERLLPLA